jgi:hypothetical protein
MKIEGWLTAHLPSGALELRNSDNSLMAFVCPSLPDTIRRNLLSSFLACSSLVPQCPQEVSRQWQRSPPRTSFSMWLFPPPPPHQMRPASLPALSTTLSMTGSSGPACSHAWLDHGRRPSTRAMTVTSWLVAGQKRFAC